MRPEHDLHVAGERGDVLPGDEEGGRVEEVEEDLVAVGEGGPQVLIPARPARAQLLRAKHALHQVHVVVYGEKVNKCRNDSRGCLWNVNKYLEFGLMWWACVSRVKENNFSKPNKIHNVS